MKDYRFGVDGRVLPLLNPQDITTSATNTSFLDMKAIQHATLCVQFGNIAAASADQAVTVTVELATGAATTGAAAIAFKYRLSGATATDTLGDITSATASGVSIGTTDDGKMLQIDIDPASLEGLLADGRFVSVLISPDAGASATLVSAFALIEPMYASVIESSAS